MRKNRTVLAVCATGALLLALVSCGGAGGGVVWFDANGDEVLMLDPGFHLDDDGHVWRIDIISGHILPVHNIDEQQPRWQSMNCDGVMHIHNEFVPRYSIADGSTHRARRDDQQPEMVVICSSRISGMCMAGNCSTQPVLVVSDMEDIGDKPFDRPGPLHPESR